MRRPENDQSKNKPSRSCRAVALAKEDFSVSHRPNFLLFSALSCHPRKNSRVRIKRIRRQQIEALMIPAFRFPGTAAEARNDDEQGQNCSRLTSPLRETFATKGGFSFSTSLRIFGSALRKFSASVSARRFPCAARTNARTFARRIACFSATR